MNSFPQRHAAAVMGQLAGWDRLRFRGTLRMLANVVGMFRFLCYRGQLLKDFGDYAHDLSQQVRAASLAVGRASRQAGRSFAAPRMRLTALTGSWSSETLR